MARRPGKNRRAKASLTITTGGAGRRVALIEVAAVPNRGAVCREPIRRDDGGQRHPLGFGNRRSAGHRDALWKPRGQRRRRRARRVRHSGNSGSGGDEPMVEGEPVGRADIGAGRVHRDHEHAIRVEPQRHRREPPEGANKETRRDDEHERQRHLRDDEPARQAATAAAMSCRESCSFIASMGDTLVARIAGTVPNSSTVATVTAAVNAKTRQSIERSSVTGLAEADNCATSARLPQAANISPAAAPMPARTRLSTSSCRASRQPGAPSAIRTLSS